MHKIGGKEQTGKMIISRSWKVNGSTLEGKWTVHTLFFKIECKGTMKKLGFANFLAFSSFKHSYPAMLER